MQIKKLVSAKEIASIMNVAAETILDWAKEGDIPHFKIKRNYKFDMDEIQKWLNDQKRAYK